MSGASPSSRWWENYLVRYFMPSIAGTAIMGWLTSISDPKVKEILFFGFLGKELSAPALFLFILYGNLFCYVASYPILGFHVTRVTDFKDSRWKPSILDGYILSLTVGVLSLLATVACPPKFVLSISFTLVVLFSAAQGLRLITALKSQSIKGFKGDTSLVYGYAYVLAKRRGVVEVKTSTTTQQKTDEEDFTGDEISEQKTSQWQREVVETYRHMREHGNSAFIFFLELVLCALCFMILSAKGYDAQQQLSLIGILFAIWALPAVSIHLLGQIIERRFSLFDRKI